MDEKTMKEAFKDADPAAILKKIDKVVNRAESIKKRYEYIKDRFPNPFEPGKHKGNTAEYTTEALGYVAFEEAKNNAIFLGHSFDRSIERMTAIAEDISI